jgi:hypothetical protein
MKLLHPLPSLKNPQGLFIVHLKGKRVATLTVLTKCNCPTIKLPILINNMPLPPQKDRDLYSNTSTQGKVPGNARMTATGISAGQVAGKAIKANGAIQAISRHQCYLGIRANRANRSRANSNRVLEKVSAFQK